MSIVETDIEKEDKPMKIVDKYPSLTGNRFCQVEWCLKLIVGDQMLRLFLEAGQSNDYARLNTNEEQLEDMLTSLCVS